MGLIFRNRQVAGNICLVVFLAFMFTLLPGQLWTTNAYAAEYLAANTIVSNSVDHNLIGTKTTVSIDPVSDTTFASTVQVLINKINSSVNNLVYKVTYDKIGTVVYSVYLWVYGVNSGTVGDLSYQWVYDDSTDTVKSVSVGKVWVPPTPHGHSTTPATPAVPATPAIPGVTPAKPATPAIPASVANISTNKPTVVQTKQLKAINAGLGKLSVPSASNLVVTEGKNKVAVPKLVITSSKVVVIMPLTSATLDAKAVNYKITVIKAYLAAKGIKNVPVRFVFLNTNPNLKVSIKAGSYFSVATPKTLVKAISSTVANKAVVSSKANIMKAFGIVKTTIKK